MDAAHRLAEAPELPGFTILRELGRGGSSQVWLAEPDDAHLPRRVALKQLRARAADDAERLSRLKREGQLGRRLVHAHILPVLDVLTLAGSPLLVLPFVDGGPIDRWRPLDDHGQALTGPDLLTARLHTLSDAALALHHAHSAGVVHRDVKPSNLLVDGDGHAWLIDFGLATDPTAEQQLTASEAIMGTPSAMAPEVVAGHARQASPATDVYALGVLAYSLAAGRPPFTGATREELWQRILHAEPPRLSGRVDDLPPGLEALVLRALDKDPAQRPASALLFAEELQRVLAGRAARATAAGPLARRGWRQLLARRARVLSLAALVLAAAVIWLTQRTGEQSAELDLRALLTRGNTTLANGDLMGALAQYELATSRHPQDPRPHLASAHAYANFELSARASQAVDAARALGWDDGLTGAPGAARARSPEQLYFDGLRSMISDAPRAVEQLQAALAADPTREGGRGVLYELQSGLERRDEARATLDAWAADLKPRDPRSVLVRALQLEADGQVQPAVELLLAVQDGAPDSVAPTFWRHRNLGRMLLRLGRLDAAEQQLKLALGVVPSDATSLCNLGVVAWRRADLEGAERYANQALANEPDMAAALLLRAQCALDRQDPEQALRLATEHEARGVGAARLQRVAGDALFRMALSADANQDHSGATDLLARSVARHPQRFDAWFSLAYHRWVWTGEMSAAAEAFERARSLWLDPPSLQPGSAPEPWHEAYGNPDDMTDVLVGLFATRASSGDGPGAGQALTELDQHLGGAPPARVSTSLNLAEALATCPVHDLRDLARAQALLEQPDVLALVAAHQEAAKAEALIRTAIAAGEPTN
ncbi:MAG: hypothetical protein DRQ55_00965 [Planctomycetota bacterium]|nr:MAG: hypothetical protein DRQ55_00965 [Planctomycetota bacterium]